MSKPQRDDQDSRFRFHGFSLPTTTPVPDEVFDELLSILSGAETKVLLFIIRRTYGFKKHADDISLRQICKGITTRDGRVLDRGTGLSQSTAQIALRSLEQKRIITAERRISPEKGCEPTTYSLNFIAHTSTTPSTDNRQGAIAEIGKGPYRKPATQQTVVQETEKQHDGVATDLKKLGVSGAAAKRIAEKYPEEHVLGKVELVRWLVESGSPLVAKNPAGYLRRAIEDDYSPPPKYRSRSERQAEQAKRTGAEAALDEERRRLEARLAHTRSEGAKRLRTLYPPRKIKGTRLTTESAWRSVLAELEGRLRSVEFQLWMRQTYLASLTDDEAVVAGTSKYHVETLTSKLDSVISSTLSNVVGRTVRCRYRTMDELLPPSPAPTAPSTPSAQVPLLD